METTNYDKFKLIAGNRPFRRNSALERSLQEKGQLVPILVNKNFEIIDGQHRFYYLQSLGLPIKYTITDADRESIVQVNNTPRWWKWEDYLNFYRQTKTDYKELSLFLDENYIALRQYIGLVLTDDAKLFKSGKFKFQKKISQTLINQYRDFSALPNDILKTTSFLRALGKLLKTPNYNHNIMLKKLSLYGGRFLRCDSRLAYYNQLTRLYNHRTQKSKKLNFDGVENGN